MGGDDYDDGVMEFLGIGSSAIRGSRKSRGATGVAGSGGLSFMRRDAKLVKVLVQRWGRGGSRDLSSACQRYYMPQEDKGGPALACVT